MTDAPPWGAEENFDAARAWTLIQRLRAELKSAGTPATLATVVDVTTQRATEEKLRVVQRELWTERALRRYPALEGFEEFLGGETEEEVFRRADLLVEAAGAPVGGAVEVEPDLVDTTGRPEPELLLRAGHGGDEQRPFSAEAVARASIKAVNKFRSY